MTKGIHHLGLTVKDLDEAKKFFVEMLGWSVLAENSSYPNMFISNGYTTLTLWQVQTKSPIQFNRKENIGLHHVALAVESQEELNKILSLMKKSRHQVEFDIQPVNEGSNSLHFIMIGPSGIRIEFISSS